MTNLDYYFRTDSYELDNIISKGLAFDYYKMSKEYGFCLYLTDKPKINLTNKNIVLQVHFKNLDNILVVKNFQELLNDHLLKVVCNAVDNIDITHAPAEIKDIGGAFVTLHPGDVIGLGNQTNVQENTLYLFVGVGVPLQRYVDITSYINSFGINDRIGTKVIQKFMMAKGYSGLKDISQNLMVLYDTSNIRYIKVYDNKI
jgi:hypothetical protein